MGKKIKSYAMKITKDGVAVGFVLAFLIVGIIAIVTKKSDLKVGQVVTNGYCTGTIANVGYSDYMILDANCGSVVFPTIYMNKSDARVVYGK